MNQALDKQPIALVTGSSSGFGLLTSVALAREGYHVLASMRNLDKRGNLETAAYEADVGERIQIIQLDVTDSAEDEVIQQIVRAAKTPAPKLRYPIGKGVELGIILKQILPWKWWERIVTKRF